MQHLSTAQEIIEIEQIVYRRLTDVFCKVNTTTYITLMTKEKYKLRKIHQTSDMGSIAQFTPIN